MVNTEDRPYTLRRLKDGDLTPLLRLLRKLGLKSFRGVFAQKADGRTTEQVGLDVMLSIADIVIGSLEDPAVEAEVYDFFSRLSGLPADEIRQMEFGTLPMMVYDLFQDARNTSFFKVLSKSL